MKIAFTGDDISGHFYPIIAIAQKVNDLAIERKLIAPKLYFLGKSDYNATLLYNNQIAFVSIPAGSGEPHKNINILLYLKNLVQIIRSFFKIFVLMPDVILSKGGKTNFPILVAARIFGIPIIIHESDSSGSDSNIWASSFAKKVAVSYDGASRDFPADKTAYIGQPLRREVVHPIKDGASEYLKLEPNVPTIFIMGGATGSDKINDVVLDILAESLEKYQIIHQIGKDHLLDIKQRAEVVLHNSSFKYRYHTFSFLDDLALRSTAGISSLVISRAGATIFEISSWGLPSIIIPLSESEDRKQKENAFSYARSGAAVVIDENNLTPHILISEIDHLIGDDKLRKKMSENAFSFYKEDAGEKIAEALIEIGLSHES